MGQLHHLLMLLLAAAVHAAGAAATYDQGLTNSLRNGLKSDVVFLTFRNIGFPKRATAAANQVLGSITFPGQSRFSVVMDRQQGKVVVETSVDGDGVESDGVDGSWVVRPRSIVKSVLVELRQNDRVAIIYVDCRRAGQVNLDQVPRDMADDLTTLRVYRDKHAELTVDWDTNVLHLLEKLECPMGEDDGSVQAQANEIYTYRRAANDDPNDKNKNAPVVSLKWRPPSRSLNYKGTLLVDTLKELIETVKELRIEIQTQREETALLRDAILNCEACKPGRNTRKNRFG